MIDRDTVMMRGRVNMHSQRTSAESGTREMPSEIMDIEFDENVARVVPCLTTRDNVDLRLNNGMKYYNRKKSSESGS
jgi:hypothetical protein